MPVNKGYIEYWGLKKDPFYLAPDNEMMYLGGQYYECFERLLYAVNSNKGGTLLVSEEAGLGKTTILLKLVAEMKWNYGENFRCAFIDHPTLTVAQLISQISSSLVPGEPQADKSLNLARMKEGLTQLKETGGKALIVIDEAHVLGERPEVLQDLRMLLNLTHEKEYLFTMVLSGQKPLWAMMRAIPEFWQRLPVKFYLVPLSLRETTELISCRIEMAGHEGDAEVFTDEALEIIQRFSRGPPPHHSGPLRPLSPHRRNVSGQKGRVQGGVESHARHVGKGARRGSSSWGHRKGRGKGGRGPVVPARHREADETAAISKARGAPRRIRSPFSIPSCRPPLWSVLSHRGIRGAGSCTFWTGRGRP